VDSEGNTQSLVRKCSDLNSVRGLSDRNDKLYIELTGDTGVDKCEQDMVWFSVSCREDPTLCVPLLIQYTYDFAIQISWFLEMPLAVFFVNSGKNGDYAEYYEVFREI